MGMFCSTIIPTVGRDTLGRAVNSVLSQSFAEDDFEVIVVNDSGKPLPWQDWQSSNRVRVIHTNCRERSVARNTGAAIARGEYLHFLDDDDWLLPGAFYHFWELTHKRNAAIYYGGYRFVDSMGNTREDCYPDEDGNCLIRFMSGEWQPLQASLFDARIFHSLGGFAPLHVLRGGDEDVDLTRRISLQYDIAGVKEILATIRIGREESTTNYSNLTEQSRQSRELILNMPGAFSRLCASAREREIAPSYWHGRLIWIYLSSVVLNFQQGKFFTAFSRLMYAAGSLIKSYKFWLSSKFWRGATRPHLANGWLRKS